MSSELPTDPDSLWVAVSKNDQTVYGPFRSFKSAALWVSMQEEDEFNVEPITRVKGATMISPTGEDYQGY